MIVVRLVCPTDECENSRDLTYPEVKQENNIIKADLGYVYVCRSCGAIMEAKIFKVVVSEKGKKTETELETLE